MKPTFLVTLPFMLGSILSGSILLATSLVSGCSSFSEVSRRDRRGKGYTVSGQAKLESRSSLQGLLGRLDRHMLDKGHARVGKAYLNESLSTHQVFAHALNGEAGDCYTVAALGRSSADLNLVVLDPSGKTLAYNVEKDSLPWASFCPEVTGPHTIRVQMARGESEYYFASYRVRSRDAVNLTTFFGLDSGSSAVASSVEPSAENRFTDITERLNVEGLEPTGPPLSVNLSEGSTAKFQLPQLEKGKCYTYASVSGNGSEVIELEIQEPSGSQLASSGASNAEATVRVCPERTGPFVIQVKQVQGDGTVYVAGYAPRTGPATETPAAPEAAGSLGLIAASGASLDERFRLMDGNLVGARGYRRTQSPRKGQIASGGTKQVLVTLEGGKCHAIAVLGGPGIGGVYLRLYAPNGQEVERDLSMTPYGVVRACPKRTAKYRVALKAVRGNGEFAMARYGWPRGIRGPFELEGLEYLRLAELTAVLASESFEPSANYSPVKGTISEAATKRKALKLAGGKCYALVAVGSEGVLELSASLLQDDKTIATSAGRTASPHVRHCVQTSATFTFAIESQKGSGSYFAQTFVK